MDLESSKTGDGTLSDPYLRGIHDSNGNRIAGTTNDDGGYNSRLTFTATETDIYYVAAGNYRGRIDTHTLSVTDVTDDYAAGTRTSGAVLVEGFARGETRVLRDHSQEARVGLRMRPDNDRQGYHRNVRLHPRKEECDMGHGVNSYARFALIFLALYLLGAVTAQSQTLSLDDQSGAKVGDRVTFTLSIDHPASESGEIKAVTIDMGFDPAVLTYNGHARGSLVGSWPAFDVSNPGQGQLRIAGLTFTSGDGIRPGDSGAIVRLRFVVDAMEDTTLTISTRDNLTAFATRNGEFTFERQTCQPDGDVNQDGSVTATDALLAFQQVLGLVQLTTCQSSSADVAPSPSAPDGDFTAADALCIFRKVLGLPSCLDGAPEPNEPPVADAGADGVADAGMTVILSGAATDPDGTIVSYRWEQTGGTTVSLVGEDRATAVFTAPGVSADETMTFRLTATDDDGAQASDEVSVTVRPVNLPPVVSAEVMTVQQYTEAVANGDDLIFLHVVLMGTAIDLDGTIVEYLWEEIDGPTVTLSGADTPMVSFTIRASLGTVVHGDAVYVDEAYNLTFRLTVTDDDGAQASDEVVVTSELVNQPPVVYADVAQSFPENHEFLLEDDEYLLLTRSLATFAEDDELIFLIGQAFDPDGTIVSYLWEQTGGTTVLLASTNRRAAVFAVPEVSEDETLTFRLTVTDNDGATAQDTVSIEVTGRPPEPGIISGTLIVGQGSVLDGDTKDASDPLVENSSLQGQRVPLTLPITVAGHVSHLDDEVDVYHVTLPARTDIILTTGDWPDADLDLYLADTSGSIVDASIGYEQFEAIGTGSRLEQEFLVMVRASDGASNYVLSLRTYDSRTFGETYGSGLQLGADFAPDSIIAAFREGLNDAQRDSAVGAIAGDASSVIAGEVQLVEEVVTPSGPVLLEFNDSLAEGDAFAELDSLSGRSGIGPLHHVTPEGARKARLLQTVKALGFNPDVIYAEPNFINHAFLIPNDPEYGRQSHYQQINLPEAWDITTGSDDIVVAVIDSGIAYHDDLEVRLLRPGPRTRAVGYDFIRDAGRAGDGDGIDSDPTDPAGFGSDFHGTHVAGTIGAWTNNGRGVAGVTWRGKIMPLRVLDTSGSGNTFDIAQAILYAAGLPNSSGSSPFRSADIINMSLGTNNPGCISLSPTGGALRDAIERALDTGIYVVIAAGNSNCNVPAPMSHIDGVITVSAVGPGGAKAGFSNYGRLIDVAAPGVLVLSTMIDESNAVVAADFIYSFSSGTSMAAPHVSGVLALMLSVNPFITPFTFDQLLGLNSGSRFTRDLGQPGRDDIYGYGLIDADKFVQPLRIPTGTAFLCVSPENLSFGDYRSELQIQILHCGPSGQLAIDRVATDASWLTAQYHDSIPPFVTARVDRTGLTPGIHLGNVSIRSNGGNRTVPVTVEVKNPGGNAGTAYVIVAEPDTLAPIAQVMTDAAQGYDYRTPELPGGSYIVLAGTDRDDDGLICDPGEACGVWRTIDSRQPVDVDGDQKGINIVVSLDLITGSGESPLAGIVSDGRIGGIPRL